VALWATAAAASKLQHVCKTVNAQATSSISSYAWTHGTIRIFCILAVQ
jgi:hypothetical protein